MKKNKAGNCLIYIGFLFVVAAIILNLMLPKNMENNQ